MKGLTALLQGLATLVQLVPWKKIFSSDDADAARARRRNLAEKKIVELATRRRIVDRDRN